MSRKLCVFTWGAILLLSAWLDNMQAPETAWAQPTYGFQGSRPLLPAGEVFRDCPRCPEMVVLPAGIFMMGRVDMRSEFHDGAPADGRAWQQGDCSLRVTRGRSFYWKDRYSDDFRSFAHHTARPNWEENYIGFRVAREMTEA